MQNMSNFQFPINSLASLLVSMEELIERAMQAQQYEIEQATYNQTKKMQGC